MKQLKLSLLVLVLSSFAFAKIGKPKNPADKRPIIVKPSIGRYEQNQSLVRQFMDHLEMNSDECFEETSFLMKNLILKLVQKAPEVRTWIEEVNSYFESKNYIDQDSKLKEKEIFEARLYIKLAIDQYGLLNPPKYSR